MSIGDTRGALDWSFLDAAYFISLKTRDDRLAEAAAEFHKVGLCKRVTFYRPDKHPKNGFIESWASHRDIAIDALERGCERTLICEDDVLFTRPVRPRNLIAVARDAADPEVENALAGGPYPQARARIGLLAASRWGLA